VGGGTAPGVWFFARHRVWVLLGLQPALPSPTDELLTRASAWRGGSGGGGGSGVLWMVDERAAPGSSAAVQLGAKIKQNSFGVSFLLSMSSPPPLLSLSLSPHTALVLYKSPFCLYTRSHVSLVAPTVSAARV